MTHLKITSGSPCLLNVIAYFGIWIFSHFFTTYFSRFIFCSSHVPIPKVNSSQTVNSLNRCLFYLFHFPCLKCTCTCTYTYIYLNHLPETSEFFPAIPNCTVNKHRTGILVTPLSNHCPSTDHSDTWECHRCT